MICLNDLHRESHFYLCSVLVSWLNRQRKLHSTVQEGNHFCPTLYSKRRKFNLLTGKTERSSCWAGGFCLLWIGSLQAVWVLQYYLIIMHRGNRGQASLLECCLSVSLTLEFDMGEAAILRKCSWPYVAKFSHEEEDCDQKFSLALLVMRLTFWSPLVSYL
jgi:hypothetical protein